MSGIAVITGAGSGIGAGLLLTGCSWGIASQGWAKSWQVKVDGMPGGMRAFAAIDDGKYWIFPQPEEIDRPLALRHQNIHDRKPPIFPIFSDQQEKRL